MARIVNLLATSTQETATNPANAVIWWILGVVVSVFVLWKVLHIYRLKYDNIVLFVGGLGSGKTITGASVSLKIWKKAVSAWLHRKKLISLMFWLPKKLKQEKIGEKPEIYSNIPTILGYVRLKPFAKKVPIYSKKMTADILLLRQRVELGSVLFIDEVGTFADQFVNYRNGAVRYDLTEAVRLWRHYTKGGHIVMTDQAPDDVTKPIRIRTNMFYWCYNFEPLIRLPNFFLYRFRIRSFMNQGISQNSNASAFVEDGSKWKYGLTTKKIYDTYCFSGRYDQLKAPKDTLQNERWSSLKTNDIVELIPHISPLDNEPQKMAKKERLKVMKDRYDTDITDVYDDGDETSKRKGGKRQ